jgi:hypothetical protein
VELSNKRRYPRNGLTVPIGYTVSKVEFRELMKVHREGMTTDISEKGLGMITDYPLEPGQVLTIRDVKDTHKGLLNKISVVRWAKPIPDAYRVGLALV